MTRRLSPGFVTHELLIAVAVLAILVVIGFGVSRVLGLAGAGALVPPAILVGLLIAWSVGLNIADAVRRRRRG